MIQHKFDANSQDRPLSGVMSAVDQLCGKLKRTLNPQRLADLVTKIKDEFGADIGLLVRMLPSINVLSPEFVPSLNRQQSVVGDTMNPHSVCFTLLRFMRIISNPRRPIMVRTVIFVLLLPFFVHFFGESHLLTILIILFHSQNSCSWTTCSGQMIQLLTSSTPSSLTRWVVAAYFLSALTGIMKLIWTMLFSTLWRNWI